jgi:hypothetical protein
MRYGFALMLAVALGAGLCAKRAGAADAAKLEWLTVAPDGKGFVRGEAGKPFVPWGFNYDRDYKFRLIEEYWENEWQTVADDFREMKELGANVVRVHLQFAKFMDGPEKPNAKALERLAKLLVLAEETGIYLDLTGLACYRKGEVPGWYKEMNEEQRWAAQARFWEAIAECGAKSPAVFFYDLMNEPVIPGGKHKGEWVTGELAGLSYVQFVTLDSAGRPTPEIAKAWIAKLVAAIRKQDRRHLVSVGLLPNAKDVGFPPKEVAGGLDFLCVHMYPNRAKLAEDLKTVESFAVGKPLIVEETFPLGCSAEELGKFMEQTRGQVTGWIGFYWGKTPAQLRESKDMGDALMLAWLELFQKAKPAER